MRINNFSEKTKEENSESFLEFTNLWKPCCVNIGNYGMKNIARFFFLIFIAFSCTTKSAKPKTVFPDYLQSSRTTNNIILNWYSPLILMLVTPEFYEQIASPESYEVHLSKGDTLHFEFIEAISGESQFIYGENEKGVDYFFKLNCMAKGAKSSFSNIVWVKGGPNPQLSLIKGFQQVYSRLGDISDDESKLLYSGYNTTNEQGIFLLDLITKQEEFIVQNAESPAFSQDAKTIAFSSYFGNYTLKPDGRNLGIFDISSRNIDTLTEGGYVIYSAFFNEENTQLYLHNSPYQQQDQLLTLNLTDKKIDTLYTAEENISFQRVSFDRSNSRFFMTVYDNVSSHKTISYFDVNSKQLVEILDTNRWFESHPSVSPKGDLLAFYAQRSGEVEVWVLNLESGQNYQVTGSSDRYFEGDMLWSPTGASIYVRGNADNGYAFYSIAIGI